MPAERERLRHALEEMRFADRIVGSVIGSGQRLTRQQGLDTVGGPGGGTDGFVGEHDRADRYAMNTQFLEAQQAFRHAIDLLRSADHRDVEELGTFGFAEGLLDGIFDLFALMQAEHNVSLARKLHGEILIVFERVRQSDPELARSVDPLTDWETGVDDVVRANLKFNRSQMVFYISRYVLGFVITGVVVFGWWTNRPERTPEPTPKSEPLAEDESGNDPAPSPGWVIQTGVIPPELQCEGSDPDACPVRCARDVGCRTWVADLDRNGTAEWIFMHPTVDDLGEAALMLEVVSEVGPRKFLSVGAPVAFATRATDAKLMLGTANGDEWSSICFDDWEYGGSGKTCVVYRDGVWTVE